MKTFFLLVIILPVLIGCQPENKTTDSQQMRTELKEAFLKSEEYTLQIVSQLPSEKFSFKPVDSVMTYTEQWRHCAIYTCGQLAGRFALENPYKDKKPPVDIPKDSVLAELKRMYAFVQKAIIDIPDAKLLGTVEFSKGEIPGWRLFYAMENHIIHHRGQCIVYLRLNGIKPKGYYGW